MKICTYGIDVGLFSGTFSDDAIPRINKIMGFHLQFVIKNGGSCFAESRNSRMVEWIFMDYVTSSYALGVWLLIVFSVEFIFFLQLTFTSQRLVSSLSLV